MTQPELKSLAIELAENKIFTSLQIQDPSDIAMVFMPIVLGAFAEKTQEELEDIGIIYEYYSAAGPRSTNGYPCFTSLRVLNRAESKLLVNYYEAYLEHKKSF